VRRIILRAVGDPERGYGKLDVLLDDDALDHLVSISGGDARNALNALELAVETTPPDAQGSRPRQLAVAQESIQRRAVLYDKDGDAHYDTISASLNRCAAPTRRRPLLAGQDALKRRREPAPPSSCAAWSSWPAKTSAWATPWAWSSPAPPCRPSNSRPARRRLPIVEATLYLATAPKSNTANDYFKAVAKVEAEARSPCPLTCKMAIATPATWATAKDYVYPTTPKATTSASSTCPPRCSGTYFIHLRRRLRVAGQRPPGPLARRAGEGPRPRADETLPDVSQEEINSIKHRLGRRAESD